MPPRPPGFLRPRATGSKRATELDPPAPRRRARGPRRPGRPRAVGADEEQVRERLLEAATELAAVQGFETCGLREIAARARVSPAMISYYFGDREGLGEALHQRAFERVAERVRGRIEATDFDRKDGLEELVQILVTAMTADPWLPKLIASEILAHGASPLRSRLFRDLNGGPLRAMIHWLEAEQRAGRLRAEFDPRWLAISVASLCCFPFLILPMIGKDLDLAPGKHFAEQLTAHAQQLLAEGLRTRAEGL